MVRKGTDRDLGRQRHSARSSRADGRRAEMPAAARGGLSGRPVVALPRPVVPQCARASRDTACTVRGRVPATLGRRARRTVIGQAASWRRSLVRRSSGRRCPMAELFEPPALAPFSAPSRPSSASSASFAHGFDPNQPCQRSDPANHQPARASFAVSGSSCPGSVCQMVVGCCRHAPVRHHHGDSMYYEGICVPCHKFRGIPIGDDLL